MGIQPGGLHVRIPTLPGGPVGQQLPDAGSTGWVSMARLAIDMASTQVRHGVARYLTGFPLNDYRFAQGRLNTALPLF